MITNKRSRVLVTIDDVYLFYDITIQIIIYYLWKGFGGSQKNAAKAAKEKVMSYLSPDFIVEALHLCARSKEEDAAIGGIQSFCKRFAKDQAKEVSNRAIDRRQSILEAYRSLLLAPSVLVYSLRL
jgi:hypothetical protein